ncbi:complex I subunit 5 family protein [Massilia sp. GCM10020059]|uniref:Na+/H+ antiporter subunit D n=1 Tax=Massilia agrisoli TaxID=2892444 RepID=A0ABS8ITI3_9BURK|nr:proton-conducting transporter membrane subunit [Massilia agrisoli]MCC6071942.1 Na+/H+ antiporter subunit D [Massilia agrisoli]
MNGALAAAPVLVPLLTAALTVALARWPRRQRAASAAGALLLLLCCAALLQGAIGGMVVTARFGEWDAPFAIAFRIDRAAALMLAVNAVLAVAVLAYPGRGALATPFGAPLVHGLLAGAGGAYATADLFNFYVWFEVMLIAALGLIVAGRRPEHLEAGLKYLVLNLFGTVLLLAAVAGLYGLTGQLNYEALGLALAGRGDDPLALLLGAMLLVALLIKAGAFPFLFWLPAAYPVLPAPLLALFTALTTKVGAYALLRVLYEVFPAAAPTYAQALGWIAVATLVAGVMGAVYHYDVRRILAFHSVSQMGYILLAVALGGAAGIAAALFFSIHHILVKANLYLIAGMIASRGGHHDLRRIGALARTDPGLAVLFALSAAALVGFPPLSGFWAKLLILREGAAQERYLWMALALCTSALTLLSMAKIWIEAFWKPHPAPAAVPQGPLAPGAWAACGMLALLALALGVMPGPLIDFLHQAAATMAAPPSGLAP